MPINQRIITSGEIAMEIEVASTGEATVALLLNVVNYLWFRIIQSHNLRQSHMILLCTFWNLFSKCVFIIVHEYLFLQFLFFLVEIHRFILQGCIKFI